MYLTYEQYKTLGGTLEETVFNNLETQAEMYVNKYTFNRLVNETTYPAQLTSLMYHLVSILDANQATLLSGMGGISSQSNDGVSVTYNGMQSVDVFESCEKEILQAIKQYLTGVKNSKNQLLLYRGLYRGE